MRKFLKEYFSFSRSESRILAILMTLIFFALFVRVFFPVPDLQNYELTKEDNLAIENFIQSLEKISVEKENKVEFRPKEAFIPIYKNFDPNIVTSGELQEIGFPDFIRKNLLSYRKAGGKFRKKDELKKIYGVSDSIYSLWEKFLIIPQSVEKDTTFIIPALNPKIELNAADSLQLLTLNGVGPYFAGRIINYRERLGGFYRIEQLMEIGGMDTVRYEDLQKQVCLDTLYIVKVDLNKSTSKDLKRHPYISRRLAESILKYKQYAGSIKSLNELIENHIITEIESAKLKPYIIVNF